MTAVLDCQSTRGTHLRLGATHYTYNIQYIELYRVRIPSRMRNDAEYCTQSCIGCRSHRALCKMTLMNMGYLWPKMFSRCESVAALRLTNQLDSSYQDAIQ